MTIQKPLLFISQLLLVTALTPSLCSAERLIIKVGVQDTNGSPVILGEGSKLANPPGIGIDILLQVAKDLDLTFEISRRPNTRVHYEFSAGIFDASGFYSYKKEREKEGVFPRNEKGELDKTKSISRQSYYFYAPNDTTISWDGKTLSGANLVGANSGYSIVANLKNLGIDVNEVKSIKQNLMVMAAGYTQAYAAQDAALDPIIASYPQWSHLIKVGPAIKTKEYYFMFSHSFYNQNKEIAHKVWDQISEVRLSVDAKYKAMKMRPKLE